VDCRSEAERMDADISAFVDGNRIDADVGYEVLVRKEC